MFAYRAVLILTLIDNLLSIIPKLVILILYSLFVGLILVYLNEQDFTKVLICLKDPFFNYTYTYRYLKWWFHNKDQLEIKHIFYILISFISPYFSLSLLRFAFKKTFTFMNFSIKYCAVFLWKKIFRRDKNTKFQPITIISSKKEKINQFQNNAISDEEKTRAETVAQILRVLDEMDKKDTKK